MLVVAYERDLKTFADLLLVESLGARTLQTLAMVAEIVHGAPYPLQRFCQLSFALDHKDRPLLFRRLSRRSMNRLAC